MGRISSISTFLFCFADLFADAAAALQTRRAGCDAMLCADCLHALRCKRGGLRGLVACERIVCRRGWRHTFEYGLKGVEVFGVFGIVEQSSIKSRNV